MAFYAPLLLAVLACGWGEPGLGDAHATEGGHYRVALSFVPDPPPMGDLFEVHAVVRTPSGAPVEDAVVRMNARMPQHEHGMSTQPIDEPGDCPAGQDDCGHPGGTYRTTGFKFHMPGEWTISVDVDGPAGTDRVFVVYDMR